MLEVINVEYFSLGAKLAYSHVENDLAHSLENIRTFLMYYLQAAWAYQRYSMTVNICWKRIISQIE